MFLKTFNLNESTKMEIFLCHFLQIILKSKTFFQEITWYYYKERCSTAYFSNEKSRSRLNPFPLALKMKVMYIKFGDLFEILWFVS